jgi:hypothetical protein
VLTLDGSVATAAAAAAVAAVDARLNWKCKIMKRLAEGTIRRVAADHARKLPSRLPHSEVEARLPRWPRLE